MPARGPQYVIDPIFAKSGTRIRPRTQLAGYSVAAMASDDTEYAELAHDTLNGILRTSAGALKVTTAEGTNTDMVVTIVGKGTGVGRLQITDEDKAEAVEIYSAGGLGHVRTIGTSPGALSLQAPGHAGVDLFSGAGDGSNRYLTLFGWDEAGAAQRYARMRISPTDGAFEMEAQSSRDNAMIVGGTERSRVKSDKVDLQVRIDTPMTVLKAQALPETAVPGASIFDGTTFWDGVPE